MSKLKVLILTDHSMHSSENSLYALAREMYLHSKTDSVDVASRATDLNVSFFKGQSSDLYATSIDHNFYFDEEEHPLDLSYSKVSLSDYNLVWLRLPPPLTKYFLDFLSNTFHHGQVVINNPLTIYETGSKEFLINFESLCPPMKVCKTKEDIVSMLDQFPIVLKPFREYGGKGIVKLDKEFAEFNGNKVSTQDFLENLPNEDVEYLAVQFLKNVNQGDKRIIVVNGQVMGASLRLPSKDSWLCNISMGGRSVEATVTDEEIEIVKCVDKLLSQKGIVMYGIDTLVNDHGKRVLSEINTTSIGGLPQIANLRKEPLVATAIDLIVQYCETNQLKRNQ